MTRPILLLALLFFLPPAGAFAADAAAGSPERAVVLETTVHRDVVRVNGKQREPPVRTAFPAVVLENRFLRITVCPALGERILNVVDKATGRACFHEGALLVSGSAYTEGGGSGGGLQVNHPLYHAGSSYVIALPHAARIEADGTAVLTLSHESYPHLQRTTWQIRLRPDEAAFRCRYRFENLAPYPMGFNPWISAAFPLSDDARFTLPADWIAGHWFGINPVGGNGDYGHHLKPWPVGTNGLDQSWVSNRQWSAAFAYGLKGGYAGIHFAKRDEGFAHVFDPAAMPGAKAAGAWNSNGWLEVWGAFTHNMEDPRWIGPHETVEAEDLWFPFRGTGGLEWANENGALNLRRNGNRLECGLHLLRDHGTGALRVSADGQSVLETPLALSPLKPFHRVVACPPDAGEIRLQLLDASGRTLMERQLFLDPRPAPRYALPEKPWHRRSLTAEARWQEAFTPLMGWGPWYQPPVTYAKAVAADPTDLEAKIGLARSWIKEADANLFRGRPKDVLPEKRYKEAEELLAAMAGAADPDPRVLQLLGLVQFRTGRADAARKTYARLAGEPGDSAAVRYHLGLLAAAEGKWADAAREAQAAVERAPSASLPRLLLALARVREGRADEAHRVLVPLLEADPSDMRPLVVLGRARAGSGQEKWKQEADALSRLAGLSPVQHRAAVAAIDGLEQGRDLDPLAVNTTAVSPPSAPPSGQ